MKPTVWEEFDKRFGNFVPISGFAFPENIKSFIKANFLSREELVGMCERMYVRHDGTKGPRMYNQAVSDLITKIKRKE